MKWAFRRCSAATAAADYLKSCAVRAKQDMSLQEALKQRTWGSKGCHRSHWLPRTLQRRNRHTRGHMDFPCASTSVSVSIAMDASDSRILKGCARQQRAAGHYDARHGVRQVIRTGDGVTITDRGVPSQHRRQRRVRTTGHSNLRLFLEDLTAISLRWA